MTNDDVFGEVVFSYSRAQAIEDGVLVDLSDVASIKECWRYPFACTSTVWAIIEVALQEDGQDLDGICHDISWMAFIAIRVTKDLQVVHFKVIIAGKKHALKLHFGPGDTAEPVLTLMLPGED